MTRAVIHVRPTRGYFPQWRLKGMLKFDFRVCIVVVYMEITPRMSERVNLWNNPMWLRPKPRSVSANLFVRLVSQNQCSAVQCSFEVAFDNSVWLCSLVFGCCCKGGSGDDGLIKWGKVITTRSLFCSLVKAKPPSEFARRGRYRVALKRMFYHLSKCEVSQRIQSLAQS